MHIHVLAQHSGGCSLIPKPTSDVSIPSLPNSPPSVVASCISQALSWKCCGPLDSPQIVSQVQSGEHHVLTAFFLSVICSSFPFLIHPHHLYSRPSIWVTPTKFLSFIQSVDVIAILLGARHQLILPTPVSPFSRISSWPESTISLNYYFYHISTEHFSSPLIPTTSSLNYLVHLSKTSNIPTLPYPPLFPTTPNTNHPLQSGCSTLSPRKIAWL